jgi:hypothetical protein
MFARFEESYLRNDAHIMPLGRHQFLAVANDAGFVLEFSSGFGDDEVSFSEWPKFWILRNILRVLRGPSAPEGIISEYVLFRPN